MELLIFKRSKFDAPAEVDEERRPDRTPWKDYAVLVRSLDRGERRIAAEGSLYAVARRLLTIPERDWHLYSVSLPDRRVLPMAYNSGEFAALVSTSHFVKN